MIRHVYWSPMEARELLAAVMAAPDDDGPRLVYADWLIERDDVRGEFIALQCAIARGEAHAGDLARERELLALQGQGWLAELGLQREEAGFRRGFVELLAVATPDRLLQIASRPLPEPVLTVRLAEYDDPGVLADALASLCNLPALRTLEVSTRWGRAPPQVRLPSHLRALECPWRFLDRVDGWRESSLQALVVRDLEAEVTLFRVLGGPLPATLTALELGLEGDSSVRRIASGIEEIRWLVKLPQLERLSSLGLSGRGLYDHAAGELCATPCVSRLERLDLSRNRLRQRAARLLASSPHLPLLAELDLSHNQIDEAGALALAGSPHLQRLRRLALAGNPIGIRGHAALRERFGQALSL
jgi:uncharacterized protein (TIGR02996 family)